MKSSLEVELRAGRTQFGGQEGQVQHSAVKLRAEPLEASQRAPLDLLLCLDTSGSMGGPKLEAVRRSVTLLAEELTSMDRLGVVVFSADARVFRRSEFMTEGGRKQLLAAIGDLPADGCTFMSGGVEVGVTEFAGLAPIPRAVRRLIVFTDGHANHGIPEDDRAGWSAFLEVLASSVAISWMGFGEDHDADFLASLADQSRGNSYVAKDVDAIRDAFAHELGSLLGSSASDIELRVSASVGSLRLLNDERVEASASSLIVGLDDLSGGETRELVFEWSGPTMAVGQTVEVRVDSRWVDMRTSEYVRNSAVVAVSVGERDSALDEAVIEALAVVLAGNAQRVARLLALRGEFKEAARLVIEASVRLKSLAGERALKLSRALFELSRDYANREEFRRNRSKLRAAERAMSKQRVSGSVMDEVFMSLASREVAEHFRRKDRPPTPTPREEPPSGGER
jgi:Mg-chelatase subunit ChlD